MATSWRVASVAKCAVLHNKVTGAWIELEYSSWFVFGSEKGICKKVDFKLIVTPVTVSSTCSTLLIQLKAGGGAVPTPSSIRGDWEILSNGPLVILKSKTFPDMQIALTLHGFIYICSEGSLYVDGQQASYTDVSNANRLMDLAISDIKRTEFEARVSSLRVRIVQQQQLTVICDGHKRHP